MVPDLGFLTYTCVFSASLSPARSVTPRKSPDVEKNPKRRNRDQSESPARSASSPDLKKADSHSPSPRNSDQVILIILILLFCLIFSECWQVLSFRADFLNFEDDVVTKIHFFQLYDS